MITLTIFLQVLVVSCGTTEKKPEGILPKPEMVRILTDIYAAERKIEKIGLQPDTNKIIFENFERRIFEKNGTSDSLFKISFDYYVDRPKELQEIYTALVDSVSLKEQRLEATTVPPP
jgi:hypothetical protein